MGEAIALFEPLLGDFERVLGPTHADTLTARNNLALAYRAVGRLGDGAKLEESPP